MSAAAKPAGALLSTTPPLIGAAEAADFASEVFGIAGSLSLTPLTGERDQNFHLRASGGPGFILKIAHPAEAASVAASQNALLQHIAERDASLPVPRVIPARDGTVQTLWNRRGEDARVVRLLSFLPGRMLHQVPSSRALRRSLGALHARLGRAMADFQLPGTNPDLLWDLRGAVRLRSLLDHVENRETRELAVQALDIFESHVAPHLACLPTQAIHNDLNPYNVVVDEATGESVTGILDFGDLVDAPLVCDVAVAASYLADIGDGPLAGIADYVSAYHAVRPLAAAELDALFDLIRTRLAMTVLITSWRARLFPENRAYILRNAPAAAGGLRRLAGLTRGAGRAMLKVSCERGSRQ